MNVTSNTVVSLHYTLKNGDGRVLDTSKERDPLTFLHGAGEIIPGLEDALEGHADGDSFSVSVEPDKAYGEYQDSLTFDVSKDQFQDSDKISEGMQVQAKMQDGSTRILTVKEIKDSDVKLDANHPLAGQTLHFDIEIENVREPTEEERDQGHARK